MQTHPLDGDGLNVELFKMLGRVSRVSVVNEALPFRIPDTILYYGSPSYWYFYDEQTNSVQKHPAKSLEKLNVFERFCHRKPTDRSDIIASFASSRTESMDIVYLNKEGLRNFLFGKRVERYGILQKFVEPKMEHCETVQVVHSPTMTFAVRRQNRSKLYDRSVPIDLRCCGFDGPSHQCEEYFCMPNQTGSYRAMGDAFVKFFTGIEPSFVLKRFVAYFRHGADDFKYLLFTSSVRIVERVDPEMEMLWGKKAVPFAALKQSLGTVSTGWNGAGTSSSQGGHSQAASGGLDGLSGSVATGTSKLLQPLSLIPQEQLDRMASVPSRAKELEALAKHYKRGEHQRPQAYRPVPRRLLSPFQTISMDGTSDGMGSECDTSMFSQKAKKIRALRQRAAQVDDENEEIRQRLQSLERDAASLCMISALDRIVHKRRVASPQDCHSPSGDEGDPFLDEMSDEGNGPTREGLWPRSDSIVSAVSEATTTRGLGGTASTPVAQLMTEELADQGASVSGKTASPRNPRNGSPNTLGDADSLTKSASGTVPVVSGRLRKRRSIALSKRDTTRPSWTPRSYALRPALSVLQRGLDAAATHDYVKERSARIMDCAARLSDLFYPLAETIAVRRKWIPKYMRHERTYGEDEGIIRVDEATGDVYFSMPRDVVLTVIHEIGAYWGTLRIELVDAEGEDGVGAGVDGPLIPSTDAWEDWQASIEQAREEREQQEHVNEEASTHDGDEEDADALSVADIPFPFPKRMLDCVVHPPYPNQSAYTFASRKLQEVAESLEGDCVAYAQRVSSCAKQHVHFEFCESIADAYAARVKKDNASGTSSVAGPNSTTGGVHATITPPMQELNPAANRARRTSMLQQLRGLPGRQGSVVLEPHLSAGDRPQASATPRSDGTPRSHRASHQSTTPSDDALPYDRQSHRSRSVSESPHDQPIAPSRSDEPEDRRPTVVFAQVEATQAGNAASDRPPPHLSPEAPQNDSVAEVENEPEWLR